MDHDHVFRYIYFTSENTFNSENATMLSFNKCHGAFESYPVTHVIDVIDNCLAESSAAGATAGLALSQTSPGFYVSSVQVF